MNSPFRFEILKHIDNVDIEDLKYVEQDLDFYEKVSMVFLLYGNHENLLPALQKLLTLYNNQKEETDFLYMYASTRPNWKLAILEALAIIQAIMVIEKLGFDRAEVRAFFLPHIPEISVEIHPILKCLYFVCDRMTPVEAGKFRLSIDSDSTLRFYNEEYLEIFMLDWISKSVIRIGEIGPNSVVKKPPDLDKLIEYFKFNDQLVLNDLLQSSLNKFSDRFRSKRNENDSVFAEENAGGGPSGLDTNSSFDRRESVSVSELDASYKVRMETAGFILIINQMTFKEEENPDLKYLLPEHKLGDREGSEVDVDRLIKTFTTFGYKPAVKRNLKHYEIISTISDFVERSRAYDSLIVCILSHGADGVVYGSNSIPVEISRIERILTADSLLDKPKILAIQACQGTQLQEAKKVIEYEEYDTPGATAAALADMLVWTSTVPGYASVRHKRNGTWFIQSLCKQTDKYGDGKHLLDIVTLVSNEVQNKRDYENQCMVPKSSSTLKKYLYLPKRF